MIRWIALGGAEEVTGSMLVFNIKNKAYVVDMGMKQGFGRKTYQHNSNLIVRLREVLRSWGLKRSVEAVFITHAHGDHCGMLPLLMKEGKKGNRIRVKEVIATSETAQLMEEMLYDSAHIQKGEAKYWNRSHKSQIKRKDLKPRYPLYVREHVQKILEKVVSCDVMVDYLLNNGSGIVFKWYPTAHILGSAGLLIKIPGECTLFISGDVGRRQGGILLEPPLVPGYDDHEKVDVMFCESTYGGRYHQGEINDVYLRELARHIFCSIKKGGKVIVPAFAINRSQEIMALLLLMRHLYPPLQKVPIYLDSPLTKKITRVYALAHKQQKGLLSSPFSEYADFLMQQLDNGAVKQVGSARGSDELIKKTQTIVVSASGMCDFGRIRHHLRSALPHARNLILIIGFMAQGTLGRKLVEGEEHVKINGQMLNVESEVLQLALLSGHADQGELLRYVNDIDPIKQLVLYHGEREALQAFKNELSKNGLSKKTQVLQPLKEYTA